MRRYGLTVAFVLSLLLGGCVSAPDLPNEFLFPVEEILHGAVCDLATGFNDVAPNKKFKAANWLISVKLAPKANTDLFGSMGGTRKNHPGNAIQLITWTFGTPGAQADMKGTQSGDVTYEIKSKSLLVAGDPMACTAGGLHMRELRDRLGVADWLRRTSNAMTSDPRVFDMHAATYNTDVVVRFTANGGYSYLFPSGTDVASLGGYYEVDKNLVISIAPLQAAPRQPVVTLPYGGEFGEISIANAGAAEEGDALARARNQNDINALQQAVQGLRISQ